MIESPLPPIPVPRLLHTADWQIGKPYRWIEEPERRSRLQRARVEAVERLLETANAQNVDVVLVAGDLFDSNTIDTALAMEVLELIGTLSIPVVVIPGNHDHGGAGGIWRRSDVQQELRQRATNLHLLLEATPVQIAGITLLPCPLRRQHESVSPGAWLDTLDWDSLDSKLPRVVLAHGSIQGFGARDYDRSTEAGANQLRPNSWDHNAYDYLALGDWHALKEVPPKGWYPGTPEPDRFPSQANDQRGQVLLVDVKRGQPATVEPISTAKFRWHNERVQLRTSHDLEQLQERIVSLTGRRVSKDLLRLELDGQLGLEAHQQLQHLLQKLETRLLHLRVRGHCHRRPEPSELGALLERGDAPLMERIARQLQQQLEQTPAEQTEHIALLETSLCELHRLCQAAADAQALEDAA